jgi:hypothetical protein
VKEGEEEGITAGGEGGRGEKEKEMGEGIVHVKEIGLCLPLSQQITSAYCTLLVERRKWRNDCTKMSYEGLQLVCKADHLRKVLQDLPACHHLLALTAQLGRTQSTTYNISATRYDLRMSTELFSHTKCLGSQYAASTARPWFGV